ncbi:uncharacterized protein LOC124912289 [Impatiens glandulifera]|uniref:uncharacterized protein LOC124912289 n=1 Tax=Impatiens glandulifera TaxID=253017 RepID=UPI001FB0EB56|nr:uncharacterized protein LOC124912289 [Impatiens glandulifera]
MDGYRSKSYAGGGRAAATTTERNDLEYEYDGRKQDLRSNSVSYQQQSDPPSQSGFPTDSNLKKAKSINGLSKSWSLSDPELQRRKRVASYKAYAMEGKVKGSIRKSFRWLKERFNLVVHGHR